MTPKQIKSLRDRLQMDQSEFARRIGLETKGSVSRLETGTRSPVGPLLELLRLLDATTAAPARKTG